MKTLRAIHLYLGCIFSPMLLFFAVSGIWQTFRLRWPGHVMALLSTIHTGGRLKIGHPDTLSSIYLKWFIAAMSLCFIATIFLGIAMAFRFGSRKKAAICLAAGIIIPLLLMAVALAK